MKRTLRTRQAARAAIQPAAPAHKAAAATEPRSRRRKPAAAALGPCRWFARCMNDAVTTQAHPVLGAVPICQRCKDWYDSMEPR